MIGHRFRAERAGGDASENARENAPENARVNAPENAGRRRRPASARPDQSFAEVAPAVGKPGPASKPVEIASGEPAAERDDGAQSGPDLRFLLVGVVPSGQCFCPSRLPERIGNSCGRGTPLPLLCRLLRRWPARHGVGPDDARCGESAHRLNPLLRMQPRGFVGLRQVDQSVGRWADASRLWRVHRERLAGVAGCGWEPVTGVRHLRLHPAIACWARLWASRHYRRAA